MKYTCSAEINLPLEKLSALWQDENNFSHWQDGFQSITHLSGTPETVGAKSRIILQQGKRKIELLETIISAHLPYKKTALYEHKHMTNTQTTRFSDLENNKTLFQTEVEYTQFNGLIPKLLARFSPNIFKQQSQKWLDQFKAFAEK